MTDRINWDVNSQSEDIRPSAITLRGKVARNLYLPAVSSRNAADGFLKSPRTTWRHRCLEKAELFTGSSISGTVLEIGAGTGWCSGVLSRKENIDHIYAVDYDPVSVEELMPRVFYACDAETEKITRVVGSFNDLKLDDSTIDYVISIGALHHSENIWKTFSESCRVLRPGGTLIACEPCSWNSMTIEEEIRRGNETIDYGKAKKMYGEDAGVIRAADNSDHFYRLSTYEAAANLAGLDAYAVTFDATSDSGGKLLLMYRKIRDFIRGDALLSKRKTYHGFQKVVMYPYFAKIMNGKPVYDDLLLILKKPSV